MGAEEKDLELEEINWMMGSGMYIHIGANVRAYWQKSNKAIHSEIMYALIEAYWIVYIYRMYPIRFGRGAPMPPRPWAGRCTPCGRAGCTRMGAVRS